jgi:hypothetical protein
MTNTLFSGVVKPLPRGGWSARALLTAERHGQLFDTQLGPREFATEADSRAWLKSLMAEHAKGTARSIVTLERAR